MQMSRYKNLRFQCSTSSLFKPCMRTSLLSVKYKDLLVKLFCVDQKSVTIALRKFRVQKKVITVNDPLTATGLIKLVQQSKETWTLEDRVKTVWACLIKARLPSVTSKMEALVPDSVAKTSSVREAARRLLPPSVHNILHGILDLYTYILQSSYEQAKDLNITNILNWNLAVFKDFLHCNVIYIKNTHFSFLGIEICKRFPNLMLETKRLSFKICNITKWVLYLDVSRSVNAIVIYEKWSIVESK